MQTLLDHVEDFLLAFREVSPSKLGRETVNDKFFVAGLRKGRQPRENTVRAVMGWMAKYAVAAQRQQPKVDAARKRVLGMAARVAAPASPPAP